MEVTPPVQPPSVSSEARKKRPRKRTIIVLSVLGVAVILLLVGGRYLATWHCFNHSFGRNCEFAAWDGGKRCVSNAECSSGLCLYEVDFMDAVLNRNIMPAASAGKCDTYEGDNDGVQTCHRPSPDGPVQCYMTISFSGERLLEGSGRTS